MKASSLGRCGEGVGPEGGAGKALRMKEPAGSGRIGAFCFSKGAKGRGQAGAPESPSVHLKERGLCPEGSWEA